MPIVETSLTIAAPPDRVWAVLADVPGQPRWMRDLADIRLDGTGPIGAGTRAVGTVRILGLAQADPIEIDALEPGRHFGLLHLGAFTGRGDFWLAPHGSGERTRVWWREELWSPLVRLGPPGRLADRLFWPVFAVIFRQDLRRLRSLVEAEAAATR